MIHQDSLAGVARTFSSISNLNFLLLLTCKLQTTLIVYTTISILVRSESFIFQSKIMEKGFERFRFPYHSASNAVSSWNHAPFGYENGTTDISLGFNSSHRSSNLYSSSSIGLKRKLSDLHGNTLLSLGLGRPSSSSDNSKASSATICTMSSAKETTDEETSMDLGLDFQLHLGNNEKLSSPLKYYTPAPKVPKTNPLFDLNLSLSTGPSESVITNTTSHISLVTSPMPTTDEEASTDCGEKSVIAGTVRNPMRNTSTKTCQFQGCTKGARGASGLCIAHGGGRRCQKEGCHKGAEGRTVFCKAHGGGRRCQCLGCTKSAEGRTDYCIAHGGGRRCSHEGCTRAARGKSGLCIRHGGGKRCQMENCTKSAEGYSGLCISHGGGRRCQYPQCTKGAQGSTMYCKAHGGGKRCTVLGCTKGAEGSTPFCKGHGGGKRCSFEGGGLCPKSVHGGTMFCVAHGGGKRCAVPECTKSARGRTDYCVRHGGGKRCKFEGCGKSAQGSTDFCKAHGGGKRCAWVGEDGGGGCDKFARGKSGMCAVHSGLVQDMCVHGGGISVHGEIGLSVHSGSGASFYSGSGSGISVYGSSGISVGGSVHDGTSVHDGNDFGSHVGNVVREVTLFESEKMKDVEVDAERIDEAIGCKPKAVSAPEGRVHGGSLLAFLSRNASAGGSSGMHPWM